MRAWRAEQLAKRVRPLEDQLGIVLPGDRDSPVQLDGLRRDFAEVTLRFQAGVWEPWPWTYADYREEHVRNFLVQARDYYRDRLRERAEQESPPG